MTRDSAQTEEKTRVIKTFEPDEDVARMLQRAKDNGITITHVANVALREWLVRNGYGRKKDLEAA